MPGEIVEIHEADVVNRDELLGKNLAARGDQVYESRFDDSIIDEIHQVQIQQAEIEKHHRDEETDAKGSNETVEQVCVENVPKVEESIKRLRSRLAESTTIYTNDYTFETGEPQLLENNIADDLKPLQKLLKSDFNEQLDKLKKLSIEASKSDDDDDETASILTLPDKLQLNFQDLQRLRKLEERISNLENRIGITEICDNFTSKTPEVSLVARVNKLYRHLNLLESTETEQKSQLDRFRHHLVKLDREFERSMLGRELRHRTNFISSYSTGSTIDSSFIMDETTKINELYTRYHNLQQFDQYIPHLIRRLKPMQAIHDDVMETVDTVRTLNNQVSEMRAQFSEWSTLLERVDAKLDANIEILKESLKSIGDKS